MSDEEHNKVENELADTVGSEDGVEENANAESIIPDEVLQSIPSPLREVVSTQLSVGVQGRMSNPLTSKLTAEHIDKLIDNDERDSARQFALINSGKRYGLGYTILAVVTFFVLYLLVGKEDNALFKEIILYFATFCAGFIGGWGYKSLK